MHYIQRTVCARATLSTVFVNKITLKNLCDGFGKCVDYKPAKSRPNVGRLDLRLSLGLGGLGHGVSSS